MLMNNNIYHMQKNGSLSLIIGPMFSGKSTKGLEILNRYESIGKTILTITHVIDNRYGENVISNHNLVQKKCISLENLLCIIDKPEYINSEIVFIEEAQFFNDLIQFVKKAVDTDRKNVIVIGLSGDFKREKFGDILELIPIADSVEKLSAYCKVCSDGTLAHFTQKKNVDEKQTVVGSGDLYLPVCRHHYFNFNE
jgi:thymidine kinase